MTVHQHLNAQLGASSGGDPYALATAEMRRHKQVKTKEQEHASALEASVRANSPPPSLPFVPPSAAASTDNPHAAAAAFGAFVVDRAAAHATLRQERGDSYNSKGSLGPGSGEGGTSPPSKPAGWRPVGAVALPGMR
jgi:hypothetical protein